MGVESRGSRLPGRRAARIRAPCLLLLLKILGRRNLLPAGHRARLWRALGVPVSLAAVAGAGTRSRRGVLVPIITSRRRARGWRPLRLGHARCRRRHCEGAAVLHELRRGYGRGHGLRAAGWRGGAEDAGEGGIPLLVVLSSILIILLILLLLLRLLLLLLLLLLWLPLPRRRHPVALVLVVGHGCYRGAWVSNGTVVDNQQLAKATLGPDVGREGARGGIAIKSGEGMNLPYPRLGALVSRCRTGRRLPSVLRWPVVVVVSWIPAQLSKEKNGPRRRPQRARPLSAVVVVAVEVERGRVEGDGGLDGADDVCSRMFPVVPRAAGDVIGWCGVGPLTTIFGSRSVKQAEGPTSDGRGLFRWGESVALRALTITAVLYVYGTAPTLSLRLPGSGPRLTVRRSRIAMEWSPVRVRYLDRKCQY